MIPIIQPPNMEKLRTARWFIGLDPAVKVDFFGVVIHGLFPKPKDGTPWNPFLSRVYEIDHNNFTDIIHWVKNKLFAFFPPKYCIVDATRDTPTAEDLVAKYGDYRINALTVTNATNYELKQVGYGFLTNGYRFPNSALIRDETMGRAIAELQLQCLHERVDYTEDNRLKFTHPPGQHNDLNRAWEMSLMAVRMFMEGKVGTAPYERGSGYFLPIKRKRKGYAMGIDWERAMN